MTTFEGGADHGLDTGPEAITRTECDWSSMTPSIAVIETVAIATNREPTTLDPLYEILDPEALDVLVDSGGCHSTDEVTTVSFAFAGCTVTVRSDGTIVVRPDESRHESA